MTTPDTTLPDTFSLRRFMQLAGYWRPRLRTQFWAMLAVSVILGICGGLFSRHFGYKSGYMLASLPIYLAYIGPAIFGRRSGRDTDVALPACNSEKITFRLLYSLLVIPAISAFAAILCYTLVLGPGNYAIRQAMFLSINGLDPSFFTDHVALIFVCNATCILALASVTLLGATFYRQNAMLKSILTTVALVVVPALLLGIAGGIIGFKLGYEHALAGYMPDPAAIQKQILETFMPPYLLGSSIAHCILLAAAITIFIKKFPLRQCR